MPILLNKCSCLSHFERSEAESRHETKWRAPKGNLLFNRFLHYGPLCGPTVEMTKAQIMIRIGMMFVIVAKWLCEVAAIAT